MKKLFCIAVIIICMAGCAWSDAAPGVGEEVFTPQYLPNAFAENPSGIKEQYMNKTVQIKGVVIGKGMSIYMTPNIELSENGEGPTTAICVLPYVGIAYWNRRAQLDDFEIGQTVTISGRVHSLNENRVLLKESKAVK